MYQYLSAKQTVVCLFVCVYVENSDTNDWMTWMTWMTQMTQMTWLTWLTWMSRMAQMTQMKGLQDDHWKYGILSIEYSVFNRFLNVKVSALSTRRKWLWNLRGAWSPSLVCTHCMWLLLRVAVSPSLLYAAVSRSSRIVADSNKEARARHVNYRAHSWGSVNTD